MEPTKLHLRHCMLLLFNQNETALEARRVICETYGQDIISHGACLQWFRKFRNGDFNLDDKPHPGRLRKLKYDELETILKMNSTISLHELAKKLNCSASTVSRNLKELGIRQRKGKWAFVSQHPVVPRECIAPVTITARRDTAIDKITSIRGTTKIPTKSAAKKISTKSTKKTSTVKQNNIIKKKDNY